MRSLGIVITVVLPALPALAASAPARGPDLVATDPFRESLDAHAALTGRVLDRASLDVLAQRSIVVPGGAPGVVATYDLATGALHLAPLAATPDTSGDSGCVLVSFGAGIGYHQSPVGAGDVGTACRGIVTHPGGVRTMKLACSQSIYCYTAVSSVRGFVQLYCQFADASYASLDTGTFQQETAGDANCQVASTLLSPPPQWPSYVGYSAHFPAASFTVGLTNV